MPWISLTMVDAYERTTKKLLELEPQADLATYGTVIQGIVDDIENASDLGVTRVDLILDAIATGHSAQAGSNVDVGGTMQCYTAAGNGKKASFKLPGIKAAFIENDGSIDIEDPVIEALLDNFLAAGVLRLSDGEVAASWIGGHLDR